MTLDPGIRDVVEQLRSAGFKTTESGDGVSKPADERTFDGPHVICRIGPALMVAEAQRLWAVLGPGWHVEASYSPNDGVAVLIATAEQP